VTQVVLRDPDSQPAPGAALQAPMVTLCIMGGKKDKLRPGDLLGALTGDAGLSKEQVGKIGMFEFISYVALDRRIAEQAYARWCGNEGSGNIKGRNFKMRFVAPA
ncbi:MAG: DbpA RNA binding domain-containing protein, partial [Pseudomonadota bacterium]